MLDDGDPLDDEALGLDGASGASGGSVGVRPGYVTVGYLAQGERVT